MLRVLTPFAEQIERVAIFGSRALGRARPASDIDLALYGTLDERIAARIWTLFNESNLAVTVDVVHYPSLETGAFKRHVDTYAKTLFTRDDLLMARAVRAA